MSTHGVLLKLERGLRSLKPDVFVIVDDIGHVGVRFAAKPADEYQYTIDVNVPSEEVSSFYRVEGKGLGDALAMAHAGHFHPDVFWPTVDDPLVQLGVDLDPAVHMDSDTLSALLFSMEGMFGGGGNGRPYLDQLGLFIVDGELNAVNTNGHGLKRQVLRGATVFPQPFELLGGINLTVCAALAGATKRLVPIEAQIATDGLFTALFFTADSDVLTVRCRRHKDNFPPWRQVLPDIAQMHPAAHYVPYLLVIAENSKTLRGAEVGRMVFLLDEQYDQQYAVLLLIDKNGLLRHVIVDQNAAPRVMEILASAPKLCCINIDTPHEDVVEEGLVPVIADFSGSAEYLDVLATSLGNIDAPVELRIAAPPEGTGTARLPMRIDCADTTLLLMPRREGRYIEIRQGLYAVTVTSGR